MGKKGEKKGVFFQGRGKGLVSFESGGGGVIIYQLQASTLPAGEMGLGLGMLSECF